MKITGEILKAERLKQGVSVADVAGSLKLSSRIINSIESGTIEELPAKTFIRGFVKSYAQFLKLDGDLILRQFLEEMGSTQPLPKTPPPQTNSVDSRPAKKRPEVDTSSPKNLSLNQDNTRKTLIYIGIASLLLVFIVVTNNVVEKYQKESVVDKRQGIPVEPLKSANNVLTPIDFPASTLPSTPILPTAENMIPFSGSAPQNLDSKTAEKISASDLNVVTTAPSDFEPSLGKPVELIVVAKKEAEFFYAKGNTKTFVRVKLAPKEVQIIRSSAGLHLKTEDGSALSLILNGVEKGQASSASKPIRLTF